MIANFILTNFSPAMIDFAATLHLKRITKAQAEKCVDETSVVISTKETHTLLAQTLFPAAVNNARYLKLEPGNSAIIIYYKGPAVTETGQVPPGGTTTFYLLEVDEYQED